jgi:hypothetical protein
MSGFLRERSAARRVLWILNHQTLMPAEVPLLRSLGFEVFVPKRVPAGIGYRSAAVDRSHDAALTIPGPDLALLNAHEFYAVNDTGAPWPAEVAAAIRRHFDAIVVLAQPRVVERCLLDFDGPVLMRAFGLDTLTGSYSRMLRATGLVELIGRQRDRFWFAPSYPQLVECEEEFVVRNTVHLPIAVPDATVARADTWRGGDRRIAFFCAAIHHSSYYMAVYKRFKQTFGDLPHMIIGRQDHDCGDPAIVGRLQEEELQRVFRECDVLYYHSREPRHLHYHPIEAAIVGMPVVLHRANLMARMIGECAAGVVGDDAEARSLVETLLAGDAPTIAAVRRDQEPVARLFGSERCRPFFERAFCTGPLATAIGAARSSWSRMGRVRRTILATVAEAAAAAKPVLARETVLDAAPVPAPVSPPWLADREGLPRSLHAIRWFDSIRIGRGRITPGEAPYEALEARAAVFLRHVAAGESVLDVGEGDGFYAFAAEERGAVPVECVLFNEGVGFRFARHARRSDVGCQASEAFAATAAGSGTFDHVLFRGIVNHLSDPLTWIERLARLAVRTLTIECLAELDDVAAPALAYYGSTRTDRPDKGFGFNRRFLAAALHDAGFAVVTDVPTPDAPDQRVIVHAYRHARDLRPGRPARPTVGRTARKPWIGRLPLAFLHVPGADPGGFGDFLADHFPPSTVRRRVSDSPRPGGGPEPGISFVEGPLTAAEAGALVPGARLATIVRHPVERVVDAYRSRASLAADGALDSEQIRRLSFDEFLDDDTSVVQAWISNALVSHLGSGDVEAAMTSLLENFTWFGVAELPEESIAVLRSVFRGVRPPPAAAPAGATVTMRQRRKILELNRLDMRLYGFACAEFWRRHATALGTPPRRPEDRPGTRQMPPSRAR